MDPPLSFAIITSRAGSFLNLVGIVTATTTQGMHLQIEKGMHLLVGKAQQP